MNTIFSTETVHQRDRFDYWHSIACQTVVEHESVPVSRRRFHAELQAGALADADLIRFNTSAMSVARTTTNLKHASSDHLFVCIQLDSAVFVEQGGREVLLQRGDVTLIDTAQTYAGRFFEGSSLLILKVPRRDLEVRVGQVGDFTARPIRGADPEIDFMTRLISLLPDYAGRLGSPADEIVKQKVLDLVAVSVGKMAASQPRLSSARTLALVKLRSAIEARLTDPHLDASTAAAAAGLSVRYANSILSQEHTSLRRLIQTMRLARCRKALEDPLQAGRTVTDIAYSWGFSDMTHFGRAFRSAYGVLPKEFRKVSAAA